VNAYCASPASAGSPSIFINVRLSGRSFLSAGASTADSNEGTDRPALCPDARAGIVELCNTI